MKSTVLKKILMYSAATLAATPAFGAGWDFAINPYIWFAGIDGTVATVPGAPEGPIYMSPSDAFSDTEASYMFWFDARRGRHGVFADILYSDVRTNSTLIPEIGLSMRSISKTTLISLGYNYALISDEKKVLDLMLGMRSWDIDTTMSFSGGLGILAGQRVRHDESWIDPMVAIKGRAAIGSSRFYVGGAFAVGGFGVGSRMFYDLTGNIGYKWTESIGTAIGYRYYDVDYKDGWFRYDVVQEGWTVSFTWQF